MRRLFTSKSILGLGAIVILAQTLTACSYVKREEFDDRLSGIRADMRQELAEGDERVSGALGERIDGIEGRLAALEADIQGLEEEFDATVQQLETAIRFNVPVYFEFDEDQLRSQDLPILDRFSQVANEYYPNTQITLEGLTDASGNQGYNLRLGMRRAEAVKTYLVAAGGMSPELVRPVSYGEAADRQIEAGARGPGNSGWENRRVVLVIDHGGSPPVGGM